MLWWAVKRRVPRHQQLLQFEVLSNMAAPLYRNTVPAHRCETWPFSIFMNRELAAKLHFYGIRTAEFTGYMSCSLQSPSNHYRLRLEKQEWVREVESTKATHCLSLYLSDCDHPWGANGARWHQHEDEPEALPNGCVWKCRVPLNPMDPMVFMIIIPIFNGYFIGNINPTFSDTPKCWQQTTHQAIRLWLRSLKNGTLEVTQHSTHCMHGFSGVPTSILQAGLATPRTPLHHDLSASTLRKRFDALTCGPKMFKVHSKKSGKHQAWMWYIVIWSLAKMDPHSRKPQIKSQCQWIGLREILQETIDFTIKYRAFRLKFSHHPILWNLQRPRPPGARNPTAVEHAGSPSTTASRSFESGPQMTMATPNGVPMDPKKLAFFRIFTIYIYLLYTVIKCN